MTNMNAVPVESSRGLDYSQEVTGYSSYLGRRERFTPMVTLVRRQLQGMMISSAMNPQDHQAPQQVDAGLQWVEGMEAQGVQ
jgi:hypothetical protein